MILFDSKCVKIPRK